MPAEPLADATRATKRNFLAASLLAITYNAFSVTIQKMPIAGLDISFDAGAFTFLLIVCTAYLEIAFAVYYWIDMKNLPVTEHQNLLRENFLQRNLTLHKNNLAHIRHSLIAAVPERYMLNVSDVNLAEAIVRLETVFPKSERTVETWAECVARLVKLAPKGPIEDMPTEISQEFHLRASKILKTEFKRYRKETFQLHFVWAKHWLPVSAIYIFRNYLLDGLLPFVLGAIALLAMFGAINLKWIATLIPVRP
jgi:hypothetical protein